jgi:surfeit locus 1 family protein
MRLANRQFKPSVAGSIATLVLLPLLISLGTWQLRRADEKRMLLEQYSRGADTSQQLRSQEIEQLAPLQAIVTAGRFDSAHQVLLDNMPSSRTVDTSGRASGGLAGYQVLTPLHLDDGYVVLVNRGWVPLGRTREDLPIIAVEDHHRSLRGRVSELQKPGVRLGANSVAAATWPLVMNYPSLEELRSVYGDKLLTRIVLMDPAEPDGFARDWSTRYTFGDFGPDKHTAYAIQWFGLAFTLLVIYVLVGFKPIVNSDPSGPTS